MAATVFTVLGAACLVVLGWGLRVRLDAWAAWQFVLPIWLAAASAVAGTVCARFASRAGSRPPLRGLRILVWVLVGITLLWSWFPPAERLVGWWVRQVTMFRFG